MTGKTPQRSEARRHLSEKTPQKRKAKEEEAARFAEGEVEKEAEEQEAVRQAEADAKRVSILFSILFQNF